MEVKQIITATVAVILICLVAIPLIQTSTEGLYSVENNSYAHFMMSDSSTDDPITLEFSTGTYKVNGETIEQTTTENWDIKAFWNGGFIKINTTGGSFASLNGKDTFINITKIEYDPIEKTLIYTTSDGPTTLTDIDYLYYRYTEGNYGLFKTNRTINVNVDQQYFVFLEDRNRPNYGSYWSGFIYKNNELLETIINPMFLATGDSSGVLSPATMTFDMTVEDQDPYHFSITGATNVTINDTAFPGQTLTIVAPIEYHYLNENNGIIYNLLYIIPILLIAAVLVGIGYSIMRRD